MRYFDTLFIISVRQFFHPKGEDMFFPTLYFSAESFVPHLNLLRIFQNFRLLFLLQLLFLHSSIALVYYIFEMNIFGPLKMSSNRLRMSNLLHFPSTRLYLSPCDAFFQNRFKCCLAKLKSNWPKMPKTKILKS